MTPRAALTKHLFDGDDSLFTGNFDQPTINTPEKVVAQQVTHGKAEQTAPGPAPFDTDAT